MAIPSLPLDLVETILDDLPTDFDSLKACAVVCSVWLRPTRRRLFRRMVLDFQTDYTTLLAVLEESPEIGGCVRDLEIRGDLGACPWLDDLARACTNFTNVESLRLRTLVFQFINDNALENLLHSLMAMETTKTLSIEHVVFDRGSQIRDFISAFTGVTDLSLIGCGSFKRVGWQNKPLSRTKPLSSCPNLRVLRMCDCYREVSEALLYAVNLNLQHLTLHTSAVDAEDPILEADPAVFESLESLDIQSSYTGAADQALDQVLYSFTSKLPALKLLVADVKLFDRPLFNIEWLYHTLENLASGVREVHIRISSNLRSLESIDWERVDNVLDSRRFYLLEKVIADFELFGMALPEMEKMVIERLTKLKLFNRGILSIEF